MNRDRVVEVALGGAETHCDRESLQQLVGAHADRVQADERPRGYRRSGRGIVEMLVPGMAEHFIARLRGLWLSYPDGSVVTARPGAAMSSVPTIAERLRVTGGRWGVAAICIGVGQGLAVVLENVTEGAGAA